MLAEQKETYDTYFEDLKKRKNNATFHATEEEDVEIDGYNILEPIEIQDYIKGEFPSGQVTKTYFIESEFIYSWEKNYSISTILQHLNKSNNFHIKLNIPIIQ